MRRVLWAVLASLALTAALVSAHVIRATSILPPGESGFLSAARLATGTGSPHLYDQQQPFIDFDRKDAMLGQPAAAMETSAPGVTAPSAWDGIRTSTRACRPRRSAQ